MVNGSFGRFGHSFHKFLLCNIPHIGRTGSSVYHCLAYSSVGAAYTYIFNRAAETSLSVPLKMRKHKHGIII